MTVPAMLKRTTRAAVVKTTTEFLSKEATTITSLSGGITSKNTLQTAITVFEYSTTEIFYLQTTTSHHTFLTTEGR